MPTKTYKVSNKLYSRKKTKYTSRLKYSNNINNNNNNNNNNITSKSSNTYSHNTIENINDDDYAELDTKQTPVSFTMRLSSRRFLSHVKSASKVSKLSKQYKKYLKNKSNIKSKPTDIVTKFITDNLLSLKNGNVFNNTKIDKYIFNHTDVNCICENIFKNKLSDDCKCDYMKTYGSQGKSGASIHSIKCTTDNIIKQKSKNKKLTKTVSSNVSNNVLKAVPLSNYYIKMRTETKNYIFIEMDGFTIQTLINTYVYRHLPNNTVNIINSGTCKPKSKDTYMSKKTSKNYYGYNLMDEADLGSGRQFLIKLLNGGIDDEFTNEFNITDEDIRYKAVTNFLLQTVLIIGHLQSCSLEFFHGDYKPENVFVKRCDKSSINQFTFNVFGKEIKVKNMGFAVIIADFDRSAITINNEYSNKPYRIISPIMFKPFFTGIVNNIIKKYGDIDPDNYVVKGDIKINKLFISKLIPRTIDPTITILRSAGVKLYRDFDLYTFFIKMLDTNKVREYIISKRLNETIMGFMSDRFKKELFSKQSKEISLNESAFIAVEILHKIKEPMINVFTDNYISRLKLLNYKLFR
jgi:hypothetical protein